MVMMHVWFIGLRGHLGELAGKNMVRPFSPFWVFLFSRNSRERFWGLIFWHLWIGRARHPGAPFLPRHVGVEFLNVGGWLTHGDFALEAGVDFLAVAEHLLIPARLGVSVPGSRRKG